MKAPQFTRRSFLAGTALTAAASVTMGARSERFQVARAVSANAGAPVSKLSVADISRIRALQLTDLHFFCPPLELERDKTTIEHLPRLVELAKPDLLLVTGDLWHDNPGGRGREYMEFALEKLTALGVPWAFVWGNHDQLRDYAAGHEAMASAKHALYAGGATGGNYRVEVSGKDGETRFEFICVNTAQDGCDEHTIAYLDGLAKERSGARRIPAMGVMHIPVKQYFDAWRDGAPSGIRLEGVSHQMERGEALPVWKQACDLRACIAGHDHVNNYHATADGVSLYYGQATGSAGYGGDTLPKGARLYTINAETGNIASEIYFPDGSVWNPGPGWRTEDILDIPWNTEKKQRAMEDAAPAVPSQA